MQQQSRKIDQLLDLYAQSHRDHVNEIIHCICVPVIVLAILGLLWATHPFVAAVLAIIALIYYGSLPLAAGMVVVVALMLLMLLMLECLPAVAVLPLAIAVFVLA